jgi:hypothetical protein
MLVIWAEKLCGPSVTRDRLTWREAVPALGSLCLMTQLPQAIHRSHAGATSATQQQIAVSYSCSTKGFNFFRPWAILGPGIVAANPTEQSLCGADICRLDPPRASIQVRRCIPRTPSGQCSSLQTRPCSVGQALVALNPWTNARLC